MKLALRSYWHVAAAWFLVVGVYIAICEFVPIGVGRTTASNLLFCLIPLFVNGALLLNAVTPDWRKRTFWMLLAFGCVLWMSGQILWTYAVVYQHRPVLNLFGGDIIFFLHTVPMIAALTMQPHKRSDDRNILYDYVDFGLLLCWWLYVYVFAVIPWLIVAANVRNYIHAHEIVTALENLAFAAGAAFLAAKTTGYWRKIYIHLAGVGAIYTFGLVTINFGIDRAAYSMSELYNVPLLISFLWLATVGIIARQTAEPTTKAAAEKSGELAAGDASQHGSAWTANLARMALLSLPLIGFWCMKGSVAPAAVRDFRILVTLGAALPLGFLAFLRHDLVNRERLRLLRASHESIDNLKRLQTQFVQSEKLASIGQLVGGAAHEINNPLTAILGYSELLADDPMIGEKTRGIAEKIREQARRTRGLVNNLLSFARQAPSEQRATLDVNTIVTTSAQFRRFDLRGQNIRIEVQTSAGIPEVRADMNQLLQVFTNIINNAVYAMQESGGGVLTVRTMFEKGNVVILFSDTGPGMRDPNLVFDPFYTTKPVGKGTGLGLSICYGLVRDQGGQISCYNRPEGGATFRIELPAVPTAFPFAPRSVGAQARSNPAKLA
ncbi:MAG TPA: HAMP domain-containing sensor histidine kinase [Candidatus Acidoferrales bacterium]|nr:HAMP domain-containing sensor histidine kinase [Candidatus Acidoferrales bacterium]